MTTHCTFKQSLALKEIGFDMEVRDFYNTKGKVEKNFNSFNWNTSDTQTSAPTRSEVLQWAREKKGIDGWVESMYDFDNVKQYIFIIHKHDDSRIRKPTHPEAEDALIDKIIEIIKEKITTPSAE